MKVPYQNLSKFVLRCPLFDLNFFFKLTKEEVISNNTFISLFDNPLVKESCFLASPSLFFEIQKWCAGAKLDLYKERKIKSAFLKYLTRMSTRSTPFGLFAGYALGDFTTNTNIELTDTRKNRRHTRFDMNYLVAFSQNLVAKRKIRWQLQYYPNTTIYRIDDKIRYIEYSYKENLRHHSIVEVENSFFLEQILQKAVSGTKLTDLQSFLEAQGASGDESITFINELVDCQLLVSELEPSITGPDYIEQITKILENIKEASPEVSMISQIQEHLEKLDDSLGNPTETYIGLGEIVSEYNTPFQMKYLFQTDLVLCPKKNNLAMEIPEKIRDCMILLNRITPFDKDTNLDKFKKAFYERYEEREMPLTKVLDVETGIGYLEDDINSDINPLIDDLELPPTDSKELVNHKRDWNFVLQILNEKLISCDRNGDFKLILNDDDFKDIEPNWDNLPDTMYTSISVFQENKEEKIFFPGIAGPCAANLFTRFCHGDEELKDLVHKITKIEQEINSEKIVAEISHLPEARIGNIINRPRFREFEIPFLTKSSIIPDCQISIEDLYISIRNNKILLRSKKLNKEIIPRLTNAHNYHEGSLPIYHFLCDMQMQDTRPGLFFDFGLLGDARDFLPRVEYKNIVIKTAKWRIHLKDIESLINSINNVDNLKLLVANWKTKMNLPKYALLKDGDNELLIDFENLTCVQMLLDTVKNRSSFQLSEFLFDGDNIVENENGPFVHEIIIPFFHKQKLEKRTYGK